MSLERRCSEANTKMRFSMRKKYVHREVHRHYYVIICFISSVIRQKANFKTGVSRKQSTPKLPKNKHFLPPDTHTYVCVLGSKKGLLFGNFNVLCFLETPFVIKDYLIECLILITSVILVT